MGIYLSQFWRVEIQGEGLGMLAGEASLPGCRRPPSPHVSSGLSSVHTHTALASLSLLKKHQSCRTTTPPFQPDSAFLTSRRPYLLMQSHCGLRFSHEFGGRTQLTIKSRQLYIFFYVEFWEAVVLGDGNTFSERKKKICGLPSVGNAAYILYFTLGDPKYQLV